jgi:hypothetical protein
MTYRQNVEASHRTTFADTVAMVAQETASQIRETVTAISDLSGDARNVRDLIGKADYSEGDDYDSANPEHRSTLDAVWLFMPKVISTGETIHNADKFRLAMDPTSQFLANKIKGVQRGVHDRFMGIRPKPGGGFDISGGGILGDRIAGVDRTSAPLPPSQFLPHGSTGLTLAKLNAAREALGLADFGLEDDLTNELYCAVTPKQITDLLNIAIATGANLNAFDVEQLKSGKPAGLMGATWIPTNRLPTNAAGHRICPMWTKSNVVGGFWGGGDVKGDMWNQPHKRNQPYIYVEAYPVATRIEDEGVVAIPCVET